MSRHRLSPRLRAEQQVAMTFTKPRSMCACGHTGDGPYSQHGPGTLDIAAGHGSCGVSGCDCAKFTWVGHTPEFAAALQGVRK